MYANYLAHGKFQKKKKVPVSPYCTKLYLPRLHKKLLYLCNMEKSEMSSHSVTLKFQGGSQE
jgi:hypothetical protein